VCVCAQVYDHLEMLVGDNHSALENRINARTVLGRVTSASEILVGLLQDMIGLL
jgi:hypothetical protein